MYHRHNGMKSDVLCGHFKLRMSVKLSNFILFADLVSWTNVSNKLLSALILTSNKPFSFFVVWLGSENLMFHKNYHRNNYNV